MYQRRLAYRANAPVVWCPSCVTVLANEQVLNGSCERCGAIVTRRDLEQWFFRITDYADRLMDFSGLVEWPDKILTMQNNWIGKSTGVEISFDIGSLGLEEREIRTFTTRIDTIFGVTFLVLAPEHPLVEQLTIPRQREEVDAYVDQARRTSEIDRLSAEKAKTGVFTGSYAVNRLNYERVPIFISDYVLMTYGTGAVMGVPAHDARDFEFARKYRLPIRRVIAPISWDGSDLTEAYLGDGFMTNSGAYDGMTNEEGVEAISDDVEKNGWGKRAVSYRIRDWLISRQRYWGTPIPMIYCDDCGVVPVPEDDLPVLLPQNAEFKPSGESPLAASAEFVNAVCPSCGGPGRRETDTMDTFMDSSWYMMRYISPRFSRGPADPELIKTWMPVDQYTGGAEHAVMHLLYSRFFIKALYDMGMVEFEEPFLRLFNQGVILGQDHEKMSKSRGNVVAPDDVVGVLGADAVRCFLMFIGPWDHGGPWSGEGINGIARWLNRVWDIASRDSAALDGSSGSADRETERLLHQTVRKCYNDLDRFKFNTSIASLMELTNHLNRVWADGSLAQDVWEECVEKLLLMLAPMAPHLTEELWERAGREYSIHQQPFPVLGRRPCRRRGLHAGGAGQRQGARQAGGARGHSGIRGPGAGNVQPPSAELPRRKVGQQDRLRPWSSPQRGGAVVAAPGSFFAVGVGPGDPELLTVRAQRLLQVTGVICYTQLDNGAPSFALGSRASTAIRQRRNAGHHYSFRRFSRPSRHLARSRKTHRRQVAGGPGRRLHNGRRPDAVQRISALDRARAVGGNRRPQC